MVTHSKNSIRIRGSLNDGGKEEKSCDTLINKCSIGGELRGEGGAGSKAFTKRQNRGSAEASRGNNEVRSTKIRRLTKEARGEKEEKNFAKRSNLKEERTSLIGKQGEEGKKKIR